MKDMYNTYDNIRFSYYFPHSFRVRDLEYLKLRKNRKHLKYSEYDVKSPTLKRNI